jgi:membrane-bound lytic murein transglycosylase B
MQHKLQYISIILIVALLGVLSFLILAENVEPEHLQLESGADKYGRFTSLVPILTKRGVDTDFINKYLLIDSTGKRKVQFDMKYVNINVTGYLKKANYSYVWSDEAQKASNTFIDRNDSLLKSVEQKYGIPKEIITSILWTETRIGDYLGKHHLPSVFFSTALVDATENLTSNLDVVEKFDTTESAKVELRKKVIDRSAKKHKWAVNELVNMWKLEKSGTIDFDKVYGSWAGAFGMSQFLPSSHISFAVDGDGDGKIDLFETCDAVNSVANYLDANGWGKSIEEQRKAIYSYNNSTAYVDAILKLAGLLTAARCN